ncbi:hypothetical protein [Shinella sp. JR1-6]|uniref:hypothetical protein n=1 Tax=Shinella sp. JR1-6 TaxID=2527671 RepID=UPI00102D5F67|nr:hypothetical protein [Shinella sp. JR1-6]TAA51053.1 hypothetical protein EXZ48_32020 [Shinella sp. JR1-6]
MSVLFNSMLLGGADAVAPPVFVSATAASVSSSTNVTVNKPAGAQVGDLFTCIIWGDSNFITATGALADWTVVGSAFSGNLRIAILTHTVDGTEGSTFNFSLANSGVKNATIICTRGGTGAIDVIGTKTEASSTTATAASINATKSGLLLSSFAIAANNRTVSSPPAGLTQRSLLSTSYSSAVYELSISPAGATSAASLTWSSSATTSAGIQIQLC